MRTTSSRPSASLKQWVGLQSRYDIEWRDFLVKPSKPKFGNSSQPESKRNRNVRASELSPHKSVTGYAQVHGWRGYTSLEERLRHDLYYVRNWSFALDVRVCFATLIRGWSEKTRNGA